MSIDKNLINDFFTFPKFNTDTIDIHIEISSATRQIQRVMSTASKVSPCHLSFYPVAKNIRFVSSKFYSSIKAGLRPHLSDQCRPGEDHFWTNMTGMSWYPWLWTRYEKPTISESCRGSWSRLFMDIEDDVDSSCGTDGSTDSLFLYLACLSHVFRFNPNFANRLIETYKADFPETPVCGLQIRRGEIVPESGNIEDAWKIRQLYTIDEYMEGARKICDAIGARHIFLSSDSSETIDYLREKYHNYTFIVNRYDRGLFLRYQGNPHKVNLEAYLQKNPELIRHYTESCLIDLYMLSMCNGYVGGMSKSEYGLCGWFLQMAKQKSITPYYNIEGEFCLTGHPVQMLLH